LINRFPPFFGSICGAAFPRVLPMRDSCHWAVVIRFVPF
jgi:hypothetical protein